MVAGEKSTNMVLVYIMILALRYHATSVLFMMYASSKVEGWPCWGEDIVSAIK